MRTCSKCRVFLAVLIVVWHVVSPQPWFWTQSRSTLHGARHWPHGAKEHCWRHLRPGSRLFVVYRESTHSLCTQGLCFCGNSAFFLQKTRLCCPSLSHQPVHIRSVCPWIVLVKGLIVKTTICLIFIKMWHGFWLVIRTGFPTVSKPALNVLLPFSTTDLHKWNSHHWQTYDQNINYFWNTLKMLYILQHQIVSQGLIFFF